VSRLFLANSGHRDSRAVGFDYKITFQCPDLGDLCFGMYKMMKELLEGLSTAIQNIESISF
jgi:hypothetical protein